MDGPDHYRKAENLLRDPYRTAESIAEAQVHATLALTAATAWETKRQATPDDREASAWAEVISLNHQGGED